MSRILGSSSVLRDEYRIPFRDLLPPLARSPVSFPTYRPDSPRALALEIVPDPGSGFYSRLFLVEKASGGWRPVIDLSPLNEFVRQTTASVLLSVRKGDFLASVDLKDAYFQIPIHHSSRKLTPFRHGLDGPSVHGVLLRTVNRPAGFHESFRDSIGLGPLPRCSTSPISGRLVGPGLLGDQSQAARPRSTLVLSLPRHSDKRREVRPQPVPVCGVPRHVHRHNGRPSLPHSNTCGEIPLDSETVPVAPEPPRPALTGVVGTHVIAGEAGPPRET